MNKLDKTVITMLVLMIISGAIFLIVEKSNEKNVLTGQIVLTEEILSQPEEFTFITRDSITNYTNYYRTFEVEKYSEVYINFSSSSPINYTLLQESDVEGYLRGINNQSIVNLENVPYVEENMDLNPENYSIIITTFDKPVNISFLIKTREL